MPEAVEDGVRRVLRQVACLRLQGVHWAGAAEHVDGLSADELMDICWEHEELWEKTCARAERDMVRRLAGRALTILEDIMTGDEASLAARASEAVLLHQRHLDRMNGGGSIQPPSHQGHQEEPGNWNAAGAEASSGEQLREGSPNLVSLCLGGEKSPDEIREIALRAMRRLDELLPEAPPTALRAAEGILRHYRYWHWSNAVITGRGRAAKERKSKGPDWKAILPWQQDDAPPPPDRISIHENSKSIGREGPSERVVAFARPGVSSESWEKTGAEADEYIRELVQGDKPGVEFMWYGHWRTTHLERIAGRDNIPWPPPEEMISGRWYAVYDEELRDLRAKPLPDSWQTGDPEPPDGWGPNSRASPN